MLRIHAYSCVLKAAMTEYAQPPVFTVRNRNPSLGVTFEGPDKRFTSRVRAFA
jgi:hypothetical protein